MKRETVGKISSELLQKEPDTRDPIELQREMDKEYEEAVLECVERCKKEYISDFYVVVLTKKERLMQNVVRRYYFGRLSCPTPEYDQVVYRYSKEDDKIDFLWVVPAKDICELLKANATQVDPAEWALLDYVLRFYDGELDDWAKELNGEKADSLLIEN